MKTSLFFQCPKEINCDVLATELDIMKQCLAKSGSPVVFSHNDLQVQTALNHFYTKHNFYINCIFQMALCLGTEYTVA